MKRGWLVFLALHGYGCGVVVTPDAAPDARADVVEASLDTSIDAFDASDVSSSGDAFLDPIVLPDVPADRPRDVPTDAPADSDASDASCAPPPDPRPATSLRSCTGADGAPLEHCREVWVCGGAMTMGSTSAWRYSTPTGRQSAPCDIATVHVHPGYIDAYEVSVARFRAWIRAGMPQPPGGTRLWFGFAPWPVRRIFYAPTDSCNELTGECTRPDIDRCTYRDPAGENDNLPVNCLQYDAREAFCWWEGKHLVTEAMWEFVARNGGRTALPFSDRISGSTFDHCLFGDVAGCPRTRGLPHAIDAHPMGQSVDPAGVFGLWGGVGETVFATNRLRPSGCIDPGRPEGESVYPTGSVRGRHFEQHDPEDDTFNHVATWTTNWPGNSAPSMGFRCARWVPEPTFP
jgi:formylglycine-generating enzyme required for sulfatase activity